MKKTGILFIFCMLTMQLLMAGKNYEEPVTTSKKSPYKQLVHFSPLSLFVGGFEMGYEKAITPKQSFLVHLGYFLSEEAGALDGKGDYSNLNGVRMELQYRFYRKTNNYLKNVYLSPFFNFKTLSADKTDYVITYNPYKSTPVTNKKAATILSTGYMLGMHTSIFENIYMDMGFGGGIFIPVAGDDHKDLHVDFFNPYKKGVQFKANLGFSIAF